MSHILDDGRLLAASYNDIRAFFDEHHIAGRRIVDIRPAALDYVGPAIEAYSAVGGENVETEIDTESQLCFLFSDGTNMEISFAGDGPALLGFNTADLSKYPVYDGSCYRLSTMFRQCLWHEIREIVLVRSEETMMFPVYQGIDMSEEDEGIREIRLVLDDGSFLRISGSAVWTVLDYVLRTEIFEEEAEDELVPVFTDVFIFAEVPISDLLAEMT